MTASGGSSCNAVVILFPDFRKTETKKEPAVIILAISTLSDFSQQIINNSIVLVPLKERERDYISHGDSFVSRIYVM